jgi:heptosyltransferase III
VQSKDWGLDNWRLLLLRIAERHPHHALALCGAAEEASASPCGPTLNLCGQLTPRESAAVFSQSRLFLGHDSGPMHLAAAVQTPCAGCGLETCLVEQKRCLTSITVDDVLAQVDQALSPLPVPPRRSSTTSPNWKMR